MFWCIGCGWVCGFASVSSCSLLLTRFCSARLTGKKRSTPFLVSGHGVKSDLKEGYRNRYVHLRGWFGGLEF